MDLRCRILGEVLREDCSLSLSLTIPAGDYLGSVTLSSIGNGVRITKTLDKRLIFPFSLVSLSREIKSGSLVIFFFKFVCSKEIDNVLSLAKKIVIFGYLRYFLNRSFKWALESRGVMSLIPFEIISWNVLSDLRDDLYIFSREKNYCSFPARVSSDLCIFHSYLSIYPT